MRTKELIALCEEHPIYIPVRVAAKFLGISEESLRSCIEMRRCPFGISWRSNDRSGYKIPTLAFFSWLTKGTVPVELKNIWRGSSTPPPERKIYERLL